MLPNDNIHKHGSKAMNNKAKTAEEFFKKELGALTEKEKHVLQHLRDREPISRNVHAETAEQLTFGQKVADKVAAFGGSWPFIIIFLCILLSWIALNTYLLLNHRKTFDPYPFILLNLVLSMLAALQAPVIMMSQNRQAEHDRKDAEHDYEVNLKAEFEIMALNEKMDELRTQQWEQLMQAQRDQINKLLDLEKALRLSEGKNLPAEDKP